MKQKYEVGMIVKATEVIIENMKNDPNYVHARKGEKGEIVYIDNDGHPTVRFLRTKTATVVADSEIEIL